MKKLILLTPVRLFLAVLATVLCTARRFAEAAPTSRPAGRRARSLRQQCDRQGPHRPSRDPP